MNMKNVVISFGRLLFIIIMAIRERQSKRRAGYEACI